MAFLRRHCILLFAFLDDWLFWGPSKEQSHRVTQFVVRTLRDLGGVINWEESNTIPSQDVVYLGTWFDFRSEQAFPTQQRVDTLGSVAVEILSRRAPQARTWLRLPRPLGQPSGKFPILLSENVPATVPRPSTLQARLPSSVCENTYYPRNKGLHSLVDDPRTRSSRLTLLSSRATNIDHHRCIQLQLGSSWERPLSSLHVNVLELTAVANAIEKGESQLRGLEVTIFSDNSRTVSYINRQGGTRSLSLSTRTWDLLHLSKSGTSL